MLAPRPRRAGAAPRRRASSSTRPRPGRSCRRPAVQARRAQARQPHVRHRLPDRAVAVREGPPLRARAGRAVRVLRRRHGVRQRVHRAQRPGRAARALRAAGRATAPRATTRPSPTTRTTSRALEQGMPPTGGIGVGHRPAGDAAVGTQHDPRGRALSGDALRYGRPAHAGRRSRPTPVGRLPYGRGTRSGVHPSGVGAEEKREEPPGRRRPARTRHREGSARCSSASQNGPARWSSWPRRKPAS